MTAGGPRAYVSGKTAVAMKMELGLIQWAVGTRGICERDEEGVVREMVGSGAYWGQTDSEHSWRRVASKQTLIMRINKSR